ncbi:MAG: uracil-DNA glycosylase [Flavobacteriaceae bacterium]|jgi:uracil-DNA glycosylase|nr:uracil-DNA glycosylase [Flavobacteriaceae bacterium]MDG1961926.1 uracil-DNA glycosylase [Flavobacteriaceae bacterium]
MQLTIEGSWATFLKAQSQRPYFDDLCRHLTNEYQSGPCFPEFDLLLRGLILVPVEKVRVVVLGQDPYHGVGQANGLAFSVSQGITKPPSLNNILKECLGDQKAKQHSGDLTPWAHQGVLLLNTVLSVRQGQAGSHQKLGWTTFTDALLEFLNDLKQPIIFLLWGNMAQKKARFIEAPQHRVLTSGHPSPLSANRGYWFGHDHFNQVNHFLEGHGQKRIDW